MKIDTSHGLSCEPYTAPHDNPCINRGTMPQITLIGINHKTAPVALREVLSFTGDEADVALRDLFQQPEIRELVLFSTCNRMEILFIPARGDGQDCVKTFISRFKSVPVEKFESALYIHTGDKAIRHLFRVACSLDSMMVGEPQILGQVKKSYRNSVAANTSGVILNRVMHKAFNIAKKVRRETGIGDNAVSISYAATELAGKIFSDISTRSVMLLGAGEMAELAVEHLISSGVKEIVVANRTFCNAITLAEKFHGKAVKFEEMEHFLKEVDIIISSTGATEFILTAPQLKRIMRSRKNRPLFFIDIAVPRDLDPDINRINNCFLYDIDDLQDIVNDNIEERNKEAVKGERLVDEAVIKFINWMESLEMVPTIVAIRKKIDAIAQAEIKKTMHSMPHLSPRDHEAIQRMTRSIADKIMHDPIRFLKNMGNHRDDARYLNAARHLFNLDHTEEL
ncbi:glutamyl-tRNA reductase [Desulfocicer vacuolatum DSM 3385]|uniref:Glutamyl-tRNA reductase n=2 Tax=Desulfocicer vacuolatum TaxID=2298 RepID=A0A1W2E4K7_9BACT|nr:glutamyl-tRNA reductase [Desulfocicer vacuolatum DSM 3385]